MNFTYGTNGSYPISDHRYMLNVIDSAGIVNAIMKAKKQGAEIILVFYHMGVENITEPTKLQNDAVRFASQQIIVPKGKKWILLYINEDYTWDDKLVVSSIPYLLIDKKEEKFGNRRFSNPNDIHLARAKDENFRYYSGTTIKTVSSRFQGTGYGNGFIDYKGEMWFLEINE